MLGEPGQRRREPIDVTGAEPGGGPGLECAEIELETYDGEPGVMRGPDVHGAIEDAHGPAYSGARRFGMADPCLLRFDPEVNATRDVGRLQSALGPGSARRRSDRVSRGPVTTIKDRCRAKEECPAHFVGVRRNGGGIAESSRSHASECPRRLPVATRACLRPTRHPVQTPARAMYGGHRCIASRCLVAVVSQPRARLCARGWTSRALLAKGCLYDSAIPAATRRTPTECAGYPLPPCLTVDRGTRLAIHRGRGPASHPPAIRRGRAPACEVTWDWRIASRCLVAVVSQPRARLCARGWTSRALLAKGCLYDSAIPAATRRTPTECAGHPLPPCLTVDRGRGWRYTAAEHRRAIPSDTARPSAAVYSCGVLRDRADATREWRLNVAPATSRCTLRPSMQSGWPSAAESIEE